MFKIWIRLFRANKPVRDTTIEDGTADTRTHKVMRALDTACREFDLARPLWLDANVREFRRHGRTRFTKDAFIEEIAFDYMELRMLDEDESTFTANQGADR